MMHGQEKSDNAIYLLIKYIKSVLWRVEKRLSYIQDARCLKVKMHGESKIKKKRKKDDDGAVNDCIKGNELYSFVKACFAKYCD